MSKEETRESMFELFGGVEKSMVVATWVLAISTFILASAAILGFGATIKTLCDNNKIKKAEFLKDLYKDFSKESISNFFVNLEGAIKDKKESELLPNPMDRNGYNNEDRVENEKSLISLLVLFDEIYYFHETKLICKKELDYFAYELKLLSESQAIQNYINQYHELIDSFPYNFEEIRDIYPFTGLRLLYEHYCKINNLTSSVELHTVQDKKEVIMTKSDCSNGCKLVSWYNEVDTASKGSGVEIFIFYLSMVTTLIFCLFTGFPCLVCVNKFDFRFLLLLIPLAIWIFLRCSRKDMSATAYLVAGVFGAFGGAITTLLIKVIGH